MSKQLDGLTPSQRSFFEGLYSEMLDVSIDRDYLAAIVDGSWPNADEMLEGARAQRAGRLAKKGRHPAGGVPTNDSTLTPGDAEAFDAARDASRG